MREWQGVEGNGGQFSAGNCVVDSLRMLPVMTRRGGTHRSAWISQQPRQRAESATPPTWFRACVRGLGGSTSHIRQAKVCVTPRTSGQRCRHVTVTTSHVQYGGHTLPERRMSNCAKVVSSLCQGVGGLCESRNAGYRVDDSLYMR